MIKTLKVKYGSKAPSTCRYHKHATIETSTTRRGFYCSLSKKLTKCPLNNRMMSHHCLDIKVLEVMEQGRTGPKLKTVTPNHIKHKPVGCNASLLIQKFEKHTNLKHCRCRWWGGWRSWGLWHIRSTDPHAPLSSRLSRTGGDTATSRLLATQMSLIPTVQVRPLRQRCPPSPWHRPWHRSLLYCELEPSPWSALATLLGGKDWDKPTAWACARDQLIWPYRQASLGGITSLRLWRKGNCEAQTSWHCLETELNRYAKMQAKFPTCLETALSKMSWILRSNPHTSDTGITLPSALGSEERISTRATQRWEMSCSISRVACAAAPTPVWKSETDQLSCWQHSRWCYLVE